MPPDPRREPPTPPAVAAPDSLLLLDIARAILTRRGGDRWIVRPTEAWCFVTPPDDVPRKHGWKLHVSATPLSAPIVLARSADVLIEHGCSFKFAPDLARVAQLVDIWYDRGSGGKFITAYPCDDEHFRVLVNRLHEVTADLAGPRILSDKQLKPGSLVHSRYGTFHGERRLTDDGLFVYRMAGPDGSVVTDERNSWFSPPQWAIYPIEDEPASATVAPEAILLGGRFRVHRAIRHANKGGVYRAVDERDGTEVVVKQARAHVGSRLDGTDVRDWLRREALMLELLAPLGVAPAKVALFEEQDDLFLVEQAIQGESLIVAARPREGEPPGKRLLALARRLVELMQTVHQAGFVINDLKPTNVMVTPSGDVLLIDVEHITKQGVSGASTFTREFVAPEVLEGAKQRGSRLVTEASADCFSLGVTIFCMATELAPTWVSGQPGARRSRPERERLFSTMALVHPELEPLAELIVGLTETDPANRWSLKQAHQYLVAPSHDHLDSVAEPLQSMSIDDAIGNGIAHLRRTMTPHKASLWKLSAQRLGEPDPCTAWNGAAGVLKVLAHGYPAAGDESLRHTLTEATSWVDERLFAVPRLLPGLAFGRGGTAWALFEAATLLGRGDIAGRAVELAKRLPLAGPSPDISHGLSGAGMAHLRLWQNTRDEQLLDRAMTYARAVLAAARYDDGWSWPTSAEADSGLAGSSVYGYAHGVAGAGDFLLAAAHACPGGEDASALRQQCLETARGAADTLVKAAGTRDGEVYWPRGVGSGEPSQVGGQWCNGPAGIGGFLIRAWSVTNEQAYADMAVQCAATSVRQSWRLATGACCGLAGVGHFLLDMAETTGQASWRIDAEHVADVLMAQYYVQDGLLLPGHRDNGLDYRVGLAGILGFLIRLRHGGANPWTPLSSVVR